MTGAADEAASGVGDDNASGVRFRFEGVVFDWRGPSPLFFVAVPKAAAIKLRRLAHAVSYGWGMIPVAAEIVAAEAVAAHSGPAAFTTALFPKDGTYLLPLKAAVRRKAGVTAGDRVCVEMSLSEVRAAGHGDRTRF